MTTLRGKLRNTHSAIRNKLRNLAGITGLLDYRSRVKKFAKLPCPNKYRGPGNYDVIGSVCFVLNFALPPFSPPLPSVVQF